MNRRHAHGFTLIEVLAALAIIALGLLAAIEAVTQTVGNATYLREKTIAHWVAMNQVTATRLANTAPTAGDSEGDVEMAGTTWHWRMKIVATEVDTMLRMDVNVAPKDAGDDASIANVSSFYGTTIAINAGRVSWDPQGNGGAGLRPQQSSSSASSSN
jgi:general secretion pathway protein I